MQMNKTITFILVFLVFQFIYLSFFRNTCERDETKTKKKEIQKHQKIPRLIFQTNKMKWEDLPESQKMAAESHKRLNPHYKYRYFDDDQTKQLIKENFEEEEAGELLKTFLCFKPGAFKGLIFYFFYFFCLFFFTFFLYSF